MNRFKSWHKNSCLLLLLLFYSLVMQSCAADFTAKSQLPGKVLSKKSLGFRETSNTISLKEVDPYTVSVTRNLCKTELLSVEHQALTETKYGTQSFDCKDAYATYIAHNITALGVPFLYDSVTGFNLLKEKCRKKSPVYRIVITESTDIIEEEAYDNETTVCEELPVPAALLTAKINDAVIKITASDAGIASLPLENVAQLERAAVNALIKFNYEALELTTRYLRKKPENPFLVSIAAKDSPLDGNVTSQWDGSPPTEISGREMDPEKNSMGAQAPAATAPLPAPAVVQGEIKSVPVTIKAANGEKAMAKVDREGAGAGSSPVALQPQAAGPDPEPLKAKLVGGIKIDTPPQKTAVAETATIEQSSRDSAMAIRSLMIMSADESSPKANKPLRDEIKSTAPASTKQKTHSEDLAKSATKTQSESRAEILRKRILIMSPQLHEICCPLTEKLFWNVGY